MAEATNNPGKIAVRLVTPDRVLTECLAEAVELPSSAGYMEVLYGHAPLLSDLGAGMVTLHGTDGGPDVSGLDAGGEVKYFVSQGFVEVLPAQVTILAETAMHPGELDLAAAKEDLASGEAAWRDSGDDGASYDAAGATIREAEAKIAAAEAAKR